MSVNDSIIISVHWNRYMKMPKNHTSTSEVLSQLFCQHGDSYAISKHGQSTLSNTMSSYSVCKTSSELLPQVQLTLSFSSVLVDCLQSGCQTVEPLGGVKRRKILTQIKTDDFWSWKLSHEKRTPSLHQTVKEEHKWNKQTKPSAHLQQALVEAVKALSTHS